MLKVPGCCCFDLETGGKIIGWFVMIISGIVLLIMSTKGIAMKYCENVLYSNRDEALKSLCSSFIKDFSEDSRVHSLQIVSNLIDFITHLLILFGISNRNHFLLLPAIANNFLQIFFDIILLSLVYSWNGLAFAIVLDTLALYFVLVLYSLYHKIKTEKGVFNGNYA